MNKEQFWNDLFSSKNLITYYKEPAMPEVIDVAGKLNQNSSILDLGCGLGKSALYLACKGFSVTAVDYSRVAIEQLEIESIRQGKEIKTILQDHSTFEFRENYDLIIAHGSLHFLDNACRTRLLMQKRDYTNVGGYNIVAVFTDKIPPPPDMEDILGDLFREGELMEIYYGWQTISWQSYIKEDEHADNIKHRHPLNKIVARRET